MGRKLEWELSGKSDVPQKVAEAKNAMAGMNGAINALGKKWSEAFKDIALGFVAPMILVQKAIGFIADRIEEAKQKAKDAQDFAKEEESKKYSREGGREAILQWMERQAEEEKRRKGEDLQSQGYRKFLESDERGKAIVKEEEKKRPELQGAYVFGGSASVLSADDEIRKRIDALIAPDIAARKAAEDAKNAEKDKGDKGASAPKMAELSSNVVGVGQSPQLAAMKEQTEHLASIDMSLRAIVNSGMTSSNNLTEKGQVSSQAPSGFMFGYTHILGSRISR
jgi:hypothetical protein